MTLPLHSLNRLLKQPHDTILADPVRSLSWITEVNHAYINFARHGTPALEIVEAKLETIFWRSLLLRRLVMEPPQWARKNSKVLIKALLTLNVFFPPEYRIIVKDLVGDDVDFNYLMACQGIRSEQYPQLDDVAGPGVDLQIVANRGSSWPFRKWKRNHAFSQYQFDGDGVLYRGVHFRPGDVLLTNVNLDGNGVYTSLSDPKGFSSHSAFFAIFEENDRRYPVVIETYEKGVRPVPLNVFLGPRFSAYAEVYRHKDLSAENTEAVNRAARAIINEVSGYNFDSEDKDRSYMSCTSVGRFLHSDAGLQPAVTKSFIQIPRVQENLRRLGYTFFKIFAPVDYMLDEQFFCIGWIDNNQLSSLIACELVDQEFRRQFSQRRIRPEKFPFPHKINRWGIRHIRAQNLIGRLIGGVTGFDHNSLPKGPDDLLAVITLAEAQIGKSITKMKPILEHILEDLEELDMNNLTAHSLVTRTLKESLNLPWLPSN